MVYGVCGWMYGLCMNGIWGVWMVYGLCMNGIWYGWCMDYV